MVLDLSIEELPSPRLQFGGATQQIDPKVGLEVAGPFDLRFGAARKNVISLGVVGPESMVEQTRQWLTRCKSEILYSGQPSLLHRSFPSFQEVFRKNVECNDANCIEISDFKLTHLAGQMSSKNRHQAFQEIVDLYASELALLSNRDTNRPDLVLICLPKPISLKARTVDRDISSNAKKSARKVAKRIDVRQLDLFDMSEEVEQTTEDLLRRDLRHALKAKSLAARLPIQLVTTALIEDSKHNQDPATRAWNFSVGLYYKSGGVPWRLPASGPETCFVGVSFHHFRTTKRHMVHSSLAQAFSSEGEGFAIRGEGVPVDPSQRLNTKLTERQAALLGNKVLDEYMSRTGNAPLRMIVHKTSQFDDAEIIGFRAAFREIPIVSMVTLIPSSFRLLRFGAYPVNVGTVCTVNSDRTYLYTTGFMPSIETYPGPHIPQPFEVRCFGDYCPEDAVKDIFNLTRMNWNTADIRGKWPVTLSFARRVGGILDEFGEQPPDESSLRYFM